VAITGDNSVSVIATATNTVVATVPVGSISPWGVAITPDGAFAYVTNKGGVSLISTATNTLVATVPVGSTDSVPAGVAITPDGAFAYVAIPTDNSVSVIATAAKTVVASVPVGSTPMGVAITPDGAFAYVTNFISDNGIFCTVSVISTTTNTVVATVPVGVDPVGVAFTPAFKVDLTPPVIVPQLTGTLGNNGWYRSNVTVTWSVTDPESGIASSSGCGSTTLTTDTAGMTPRCSAMNGARLFSSVPVTIKIDKTPPVATATPVPAPNGNGWNSTNVTVTFTGTDNVSGIDSCSAPVTLTNQGAGQTATGTCTDKAGNVSAPVTATMKIDKTPPVISGMPAAGCSLWPPNHKLVQVAIVTAADALSGLAPGTFKVTGKSNEPIDPTDPAIVVTPNGSGGFIVQLQVDRLGTGTGRIYTLTATADDLAGNTGTVTATCTVPLRLLR
jgi:YVTN family beta-propeller protein